MEQISIIQQKINSKKNLLHRLLMLKMKLENLYINNQNNGKPLLYPLTQEIIYLYKANEKAIETLKKEIEEQESANN